VEHARLSELEALLEAKHKELEDAQVGPLLKCFCLCVCTASRQYTHSVATGILVRCCQAPAAAFYCWRFGT
jgi:hypothetical protein